MKNTVPSLLWALSKRGARVVVARGIVCALLLLTGGAALGIRGQEDRPPGEDQATATPTPVPTPQTTPLKHTGRYRCNRTWRAVCTYGGNLRHHTLEEGVWVTFNG